MQRLILSLLFLSISIFSLDAQSKKMRFKRMTKAPKILKEISGLYIQGDTIWGHNDSGGEPRLYAFNQKGKLLRSVLIEGAQNKDWEELAYDDKGNIFICDFGNNGNVRKDLRVFKWNKVEGLIGRLSLSYADQQKFPPARDRRKFDAEGSFWYQDSLYIFSKNRSGFFTHLYVIGDEAGSYKPAMKDSINLEDRIVTAAALSPDGKTMALLAYKFGKKWIFPRFESTLFIFRNFSPGNFCDGEMQRLKLPHRQFEALDFKDNKTLYLGAEKTPIHKAIVGKVVLRE
ncbi:MAG: hypothetical protein AAF696_38155 [Bacteroidota bacterium]